MADTASERYELSIRARRGAPDAPLLHALLEPDEVNRYLRVRVEHVCSHYSVNLEEAWGRFLRDPAHPVGIEVTGYETVVKFGDTVQLTRAFFVEVERHPPDTSIA